MLESYKNLSKEIIVEKLLKKRIELGFTQAELAEYLGMPTTGERSIRRWESGEVRPSESKYNEILNISLETPYKLENLNPSFKFIDLFAGIGGIRLPFQELGGECVFTSEWDKFSKKTYAANFGELPKGDITNISVADIPEHDILLGGFPCQAFSQAGLKKGFMDTRGTMFFEIQRILSAKRPKAFLLENVKQLKGHDRGRTLQSILDILQGRFQNEIPEEVSLSDETRESFKTKLNYWVDFKVIKANDFGVPQKRERIYIVGFDLDYFSEDEIENYFCWPEPLDVPTKLGYILEDSKNIDSKYTISDRLWAGHQRRRKEHAQKGNGFGYSLFNAESPYTNTMSARYYKDGSEILIDQSELKKNPRKLTPKECARLQGFPEEFIVDAVSTNQIYKQFGNSVSMPVIRQIAKCMLNVFNKNAKRKSNKKPAKQLSLSL